ncbi:MAG: hypothetical protein JWQ71_1275 [Pedosphaera sp.]|nr:hypothetical protein [Pedosphaera sp.]
MSILNTDWLEWAEAEEKRIRKRNEWLERLAAIADATYQELH